MMFAIISFREDGRYAKKDVIKAYKSQKVAQKGADRINAQDPCRNLVVREIKYLSGTYDQLPDSPEAKLVGTYINEITGTLFTIEGNHTPNRIRLIFTDTNGCNRSSEVELIDAERLVAHSKKQESK